MKDKIVGFCNRTKSFIVANGSKVMAAAIIVTSASSARATDYDPASLHSGVATLFQGAIAVAGVIAATLIGIRIVKKAIRAA